MGQNNILIVGLQSVGKSSIVKRIMDLSFDTKLRPTLGFQVFNFMMEKVNFRIFDAPGQEKLRDTWYDTKLNPQAIVYVIDLTSSNEIQQIAKKEFDRIVEFYITNTPNKKMPILILGNKIDLKPDKDLLLNDIFWNVGDLNYHFGYCSAKTMEGIKENLGWIFAEFIKNQI